MDAKNVRLNELIYWHLESRGLTPRWTMHFLPRLDDVDPDIHVYRITPVHKNRIIINNKTLDITLQGFFIVKTNAADPNGMSLLLYYFDELYIWLNKNINTDFNQGERDES